MKYYSYMNKDGLKVLRIAALSWIVLLIVALLICIILNVFKLQFVDNYSIIIASIFIIVVLSVLFISVVPFFRFKHFRYFLDDKEVHVRKGIIFINTQIIPYFRIQNIDINEGFIMRKYQLATLTLSAAGGNSEIILINKKEAHKLKTLIKQRKDVDINEG